MIQYLQHPAPTLFCTCERTEAELTAEARHAMAVLNALRVTQEAGRASFNDLAGSMVAYRSGFGDPAGVAVQDPEVRPLSDALGHYRILRTSPLTPVPEVCCPGC